MITRVKTSSDTGRGYNSDNENSKENEEIPEESTGGIVFDRSRRSFSRSESQSVKVEISSGNKSEDEISDDKEDDKSPSCVVALEWDWKSKKNETTVRAMKQKSFMYIVMQLCLKETLRDWLRLNPSRDKTKVYSVFCQICAGVEYVHSQSLVHRDLKPSNIYFSSEGVIKIGDFGLVTDNKLDQSGDHHGGQKLQRHHHRQHTDQVGTLTRAAAAEAGRGTKSAEPRGSWTAWTRGNQLSE